MFTWIGEVEIFDHIFANNEQQNRNLIISLMETYDSTNYNPTKLKAHHNCCLFCIFFYFHKKLLFFQAKFSFYSQVFLSKVQNNFLEKFHFLFTKCVKFLFHAHIERDFQRMSLKYSILFTFNSIYSRCTVTQNQRLYLNAQGE